MPTALATAPSPAPLATAASQGIRKVALGGIKKKEPVGKPAKNYPVIPDDPDHEISSLAHAIREDQETFDALEGALKVNKARLRTLTSPFYFKENHGKVEVPSSVRCRVTEEQEDGSRKPTGSILVTFQNKYGKADEDKMAAAIGADRTARYFRQQFELKMDGDNLPAEKAGDIIEAVQAILEEHNCLDALSVAEKIVPTADFHIARHTAFTPEENAEIDLLLPCQAIVKTKNITE